MNGYYSVFDPDGKKIADCGIERDAVNLMNMRNQRWDGHYFMFSPLPGDIIDMATIDDQYAHHFGEREALPIEYIEVGGQKLPTQQNLPQSNENPLDLK